MRRSGSAIIIAFLLMAVVSGTAFAIAKLFYLDTAVGELYENSTVAYYAAESGIEEGLLRYRFNRNAEVESVSVANDYLNYNQASRGNLVTGAVNSVLKTLKVTPANQQVYELNEYYKNKFYGADVNEDGILSEDDLLESGYETNNPEYVIPRDESIKLDITSAVPNTSTDLDFFTKLTPEPDESGMAEDQIFIEAKVTGMINGRLTESKKVLVIQKPNSQYGTWDANSYIVMDQEIGLGVYFVNDLITKIAPALTRNGSNTPQAFLYLKPVGCSAVIGITPTGNYPIVSPYTTVKSTGFYGGVGRTLSAKIDRQSGTVYDIFDFVIYQK